MKKPERKKSKEAGRDRGFCNAVQIAKDLREYVLEGGQRPGRDNFRPAPAERTLWHNQHQREVNCVCMHLSILRVYEKAHDRGSQNREFVKITLLKRGSMFGVIIILRTIIFLCSM